MRKYVIIGIVFITIILGFFTGFYLYKISKIEEINLELAEKTIDDECTEFAELYEIAMRDLKETSNNENKISPNCTLIIEKYYKDCNHIIQTSEQIKDETLINLTSEEFSKKYSEWKIKKFMPQEIIIYKEIDDFCNEHYILKEKNGYIAIYKLNKNNEETLEKVTDITVEYLPKADIEEIKRGIKIYTKAELNKTLQDFE